MIQTQIKTIIKEPRITLVGAGPGDAELISLKGVRVLKSADVVLYDALVNNELLDLYLTNFMMKSGITPLLNKNTVSESNLYPLKEISK